MAITTSFMCLLILLLFCFSFGYALHGDDIEAPSVDFVSNAKVMKHDDIDAMKKVQAIRGTSTGEEFGKETTTMTMKKPTKKETSVEEEDDLVAFTADYWKPRHHPPKNN